MSLAYLSMAIFLTAVQAQYSQYQQTYQSYQTVPSPSTHVYPSPEPMAYDGSGQYRQTSYTNQLAASNVESGQVTPWLVHRSSPVRIPVSSEWVPANHGYETVNSPVATDAGYYSNEYSSGPEVNNQGYGMNTYYSSSGTHNQGYHNNADVNNPGYDSNAAMHKKGYHNDAYVLNQGYDSNAVVDNQGYHNNVAVDNQGYHNNAYVDNQDYHSNAAVNNQGYQSNAYHTNSASNNQHYNRNTARNNQGYYDNSYSRGSGMDMSCLPLLLDGEDPSAMEVAMLMDPESSQNMLPYYLMENEPENMLPLLALSGGQPDQAVEQYMMMTIDQELF